MYTQLESIYVSMSLYPLPVPLHEKRCTYRIPIESRHGVLSTKVMFADDPCIYEQQRGCICPPLASGKMRP